MCRTAIREVQPEELPGKLEYRLCGVIEELDEGDPELIFVKRLTGSARQAATE